MGVGAHSELPARSPGPRTPDSYKRDLASALESPVKGLASSIANRMTDEEQQAATKASAEEAINIAAKSKGIAEGDTQFLMRLIKASALEEVAVNVQTAIQVKEREMKQAKKYRTAKHKTGFRISAWRVLEDFFRLG